MKVIANMFIIGLPMLIIFYNSNYFEFIFKNGISLPDHIFNLCVPILKKKNKRLYE